MTDETTVLERARRNATGIVATAVTGTWLAALMLGADWWLAAMLFGYIVIVPVTAMLFDDEDPETVNDSAVEARAGRTRASAGGRTDALELIRTRYAAGELTDEAFERKLDRLLETETITDAQEWMDRTRDDDGRANATDRDAESSAATEPDR
ncbi:hypothetical protein JCM18237_07590 [Halorubrum luteum]